MKFNHLTVGTNYYVTEDTKNIFSKSVYKSFSEEVFWQMVKEGGEALEIIRGIFFKGNIKENSYELIVMDRKRNILMCSAGVADVESQKIVVKQLETIYRGMYLRETKIKECSVPAIYDLYFDSTLETMKVDSFVREFCAAMGAVAFEYFRNNSK